MFMKFLFYCFCVYYDNVDYIKKTLRGTQAIRLWHFNENIVFLCLFILFFKTWGLTILPRVASNSWDQTIILPQPPMYVGL
jgi:hypothetical protein